MTFEQFATLTPDQQRQAVQAIYAGPDHPVFAGVREAFRRAYPQVDDGHRLFVGMGSGLGTYQAISVEVRRGARRLRLPTNFMGFPVVRRYTPR